MRRVASLLVLFTLAIGAPLAAQQPAPFQDPANLRGERVSPRTGRELPVDQGARGLAQMLRRLNTRGSLLLIVAHPDDEDGGMLTLVSRGLGARVATLTLNRGEGGQNAVTADFEDALGLIRTQELLSADRYFGAGQMFGTEVDFGFSKTKQEAFAKWGHERVLYNAVRAVRLYRPLVIAAVFVGGVTDGHGQHQVSGEIAQEVFKAAGDPHVFPELTREGILPWTPIKVYARVPRFAITAKGLFDYATYQYVKPRFTNYVTDQTTTTAPKADVIVHEGTTDPLLTVASARPEDMRGPEEAPDTPLSYVQFARIGLGLQRTQIGPGVRLAAPGAYDVAYHRYGSHLKTQPAQESSFFDGIDTGVRGILTLSAAPPPELRQGVNRLATQMAAAAKALDPQHPEALAPQLVAAQHDLGALLDWAEKTKFPGKADVLHDLRIKQVQLNDALLLALGVEFQATVRSPQRDLPQGEPVTVHTTLRARSGEPAGVFAERLETGEQRKDETLLAIDTEPSLRAGEPLQETLQVGPALTQTVTRPYFFRTSIEQPVYQLLQPALRNAPQTPPALTAWATLRYHQTQIEVGRVVDAGDQAVAIVPTATISLPTHAAVLPDDRNSLVVDLQVQPANLRVKAQLPASWSEKPQPEPPDAAAGLKQLLLSPPAAQRTPVDMKAAAVRPGDGEVRDGFRSVGYGNLQRTNYFTAADLRIVPVRLELPKRRRIGYLPGTGDAVPDNLASVGLPVTLLRVADLTPAKLAAFDSVVLGVRTYNAHPDLHGAATEALLNFARGGGNVIVQYQTADFTGADAPYPVALGNAEKVVDERAPVELLAADAPLFTAPNRITPADFGGWVEERGHGFLESWDSHYTALTETHDPGAPSEGIKPQLPQRGGLITTPLGKGHWTYCAFALYRQLPEAVPGAFRLFVNLLD